MNTLDVLRAVTVIAAEGQSPRQGRLQQTLLRAQLAAPEVVVGLAELEDRLRQAVRYREHHLGLVIVTARLWSKAAPASRQRLQDLAAECGAVLGLFTSATRDAHTLEAAKAAGFAFTLSGTESPEQLLQVLSLALALRQERQLRHQREAHLEGQLSERKVMEARLHFIAYHDELTGLYNRRRLSQLLDLALLRGRQAQQSCSVLLLDLDRFKLVNDLEGHEAGDRMLIELSRLLMATVGERASVARIGSDEFVLLIEDCGAEQAMRWAEDLRQRLELHQFACVDRQHHTCASIGVATAEPDDMLNAGELLARADQACFVAKENGRNRIHQYRGSDPQLVHLRADFAWAPRIREALEGGRLFLHYQPVVRLSDGAITHYEILVRMRDAEGRVHGPGEFIPAAERTGLIHDIDLWVVDQAVDFVAGLPPEQSELSVTVNLSGHAFNNRRLLEMLTRKLELTWVSPERLVFEITETAAVSNLEQGRQLVARLRALGCRFALDDFGAGFSTFHYLKQFPVDYLKIDGSFIVNLTGDRVDQALVQHMIAVGHGLGKKIVAEFVEDGRTLELLRRMGADYVQGHYIGAAGPKLREPGDLPAEVRDGGGPCYGTFDDTLLEEGVRRKLRLAAGGGSEEPPGD